MPVTPFDYSDTTEMDGDVASSGRSSHPSATTQTGMNTGGGAGGGSGGGVDSVRPPFVALVQQGVAAVGAMQLHKITHALQAIELSLQQSPQLQPQQPQTQLSSSSPLISSSSPLAAAALIREIIPPFTSRVLAAQASVLHDLMLSYKSSGKLLYVVLRVFRTLLAKGLCSDNTREEEGEGGGDGSGEMKFEDDVDGTGKRTSQHLLVILRYHPFFVV